MNKQTSIEWLISKIESNINPSLTQKELIEIINQSKQMHKEEIVNAWIQATPRNIPKYEAITKDYAEQYYQETYGWIQLKGQ